MFVDTLHEWLSGLVAWAGDRWLDEWVDMDRWAFGLMGEQIGK